MTEQIREMENYNGEGVGGVKRASGNGGVWSEWVYLED